VAGTTVEGAYLDTDRFFGVGSGSHCVGGHDSSGPCSGLGSLVRRGPSQLLCWRLGQVRVVIWPLLALSAWAQPATVVAGTTGDGANVAFVHLFGMGPASHFFGGHDR
jgi:hypothetical protein